MTTLEALTSRQEKILTFIRDHVAEQGYPPTLREVGKAVDLVQPSSVAYQLGELERKGWIRRDRTRPRAIVLVDPEAPGHQPCGACGGSGTVPAGAA